MCLLVFSISFTTNCIKAYALFTKIFTTARIDCKIILYIQNGHKHV